MDDGMEPILDSDNEPRRNPPLPKAVRAGAYLGLAAGWMAGLVYVVAVFLPIRFEQVSTADGILIAVPVIGAAVGAAVGWLLRNSERFLLVIAPCWTTLNDAKWGSRSGGIVGLFLAMSYIRANSPLGFYPGSIALAFELIVPACAALGAGVALLLTVRRNGADPPTISE